MRRWFQIRTMLVFAAVLATCRSAFAIDPAMIEAAKREGSVTVYTTLVIDQIARPMARAFEAKYGIKVNPVRADTAEIVRRVMPEAQAGRPQGDVFDGSTPAATLKRQNLVLKWLPETAANLPKEFVDADGYWSALYVLVCVPGVNTELVPAGTEPKSWEDLLAPRWNGKMVWSSGPSVTGGAGFVALVLREYGEAKGRAFLAQLAKQNVINVASTTRQVVDQMIAGEYDLNIMSPVHQVLYSAARGAPVKWLPFSPASVSLSTTSVARYAPHPNAAKLYVDFQLSDEGQAIFRDNYYIPASTRVVAKDPKALPDGMLFRAQYFTPEEIDSQMPTWIRTFEEYFR